MTETKFLPAPVKTREQLAECIGDPQEWSKEFLFLEGNEVPLFCCPQCGAACPNPYQHKAWHLQNCI